VKFVYLSLGKVETQFRTSSRPFQLRMIIATLGMSADSLIGDPVGVESDLCQHQWTLA
jgi:hypothetical protein